MMIYFDLARPARIIFSKKWPEKWCIDLLNRNLNLINTPGGFGLEKDYKSTTAPRVMVLKNPVH